MKKLIVGFLAGVICLLGVTSVMAYNEAPMLRVRVAAGELPPVEERLPEEPLVIEPVEEIGQYGGMLRTLTLSPTTYGDAGLFLYAPMLSLTPDLKTIKPGIAKGWKLSEDGKTLTLYLRKGMRWSDGAPFTADDIMFWYEDIILDDELVPVKPSVWSPGGELMKMEKIDDYTVQMRFAAPHPFATTYLAHSFGWAGAFFLPKHYLKQFHPRYVPTEKLEEMVKEKGFDQWYQLFFARGRYFQGMLSPTNPDLPTLSAYILKDIQPGYRFLERNPYYWQVDTEGNQLPYVDKILLTLVENEEMYAAKVITAQVDFAAIQTSVKDLSLYMENEEKGDYRVIVWQSCAGADIYFQPNLTYLEDLVLRDLFRDVRFRRALSLAIDREEINEVVYYGLAIPRQYTVIPGCNYYEEEFSKAFAEYDPEKANRLLDEMDLKWDKNHQWRLRPDGERLTWTIEYCPLWGPRTAVSELVKEQWKDIGVDVALKEISLELDIVRYPGNQVAMGNWVGSGSTDLMFIVWGGWVWWPTIVGLAETTWPEWARWHLTKGEEGEEPPPEVKKLHQLHEELVTTVDQKERIRIGKEILRIHAENVWNIGTVGLAPRIIIANNNLQNVPEEKIYWDWDSLFGYYVHPAQFFFKQR